MKTCGNNGECKCSARTTLLGEKFLMWAKEFRNQEEEKSTP